MSRAGQPTRRRARTTPARFLVWGVVSHESALGVHQIGEFEAARVHLTVPPSFTMTEPALAIHRRTRSTFSADACRFNDGTVTTAPNSPGQRL